MRKLSKGKRGINVGSPFTINQQDGSICEIKDVGSSPRLTLSQERGARREEDMGVLLTGAEMGTSMKS